MKLFTGQVKKLKSDGSCHNSIKKSKGCGAVCFPKCPLSCPPVGGSASPSDVPAMLASAGSSCKASAWEGKTLSLNSSSKNTREGWKRKMSSGLSSPSPALFGIEAGGNNQFKGGDFWKPQTEYLYNNPKTEADKLTSCSFVLLSTAGFSPVL